MSDDPRNPLANAQIVQPSSEDFVIREHTYSMCPGCPTFKIPVPIPKETLSGGEGGSAEQLQQPYPHLQTPPSASPSASSYQASGSSYQPEYYPVREKEST